MVSVAHGYGGISPDLISLALHDEEVNTIRDQVMTFVGWSLGLNLPIAVKVYSRTLRNPRN